MSQTLCSVMLECITSTKKKKKIVLPRVMGKETVTMGYDAVQIGNV